MNDTIIPYSDVFGFECKPLPEFRDMRHVFARMGKFEVVDFVRQMYIRRKLIAEAERYGEA